MKGKLKEQIEQMIEKQDENRAYYQRYLIELCSGLDELGEEGIGGRESRRLARARNIKNTGSTIHETCALIERLRELISNNTEDKQDLVDNKIFNHMTINGPFR